MTSKVFVSVLVALALVQFALAEPILCPNPEAAKTLHYKQEVHEAAPDFGRTEKVLTAPRSDKPLSCVLLTGLGAQSGSSITAVGLSDNGVTVKLVSGIKQGIDATVELYTE